MSKLRGIERIEAIKQEVDYEISRSKERENEVKKIKNLLIEGGWKEGVDFVDESGWKKRNTTITIGSYGDNSRESIQTTIELFGGNLSPIMVRKNEKGEAEKEAYGWFRYVPPKKSYYNSNKYKPTVQSSYITGNYRSYKPETLLERLKLKNKKKILEIENENRRDNVYERTFESLIKKFPNATVEKINIYTRYNSYPAFKISFENGNYMKVVPGYEVGKETVKETFIKKIHETKDVSEMAALLS